MVTERVLRNGDLPLSFVKMYTLYFPSKPILSARYPFWSLSFPLYASKIPLRR